MSNNDNNKDSRGLGLVYGAAFGIIVGMIFDKMLIGIAFGPLLGLILGTIIDPGKK